MSIMNDQTKKMEDWAKNALNMGMHPMVLMFVGITISDADTIEGEFVDITNKQQILLANNGEA